MEDLVVGIPAQYHCSGLHPQILQKWTNIADLLHNAGAKVVPVSLPHTPYAPACYTVLNTSEVASNFTRYTGGLYGSQQSCSHSMEAQYALTRATGLSQVVRDRVLAGNFFLLADNKQNYQQQAMKVRRLIQDDFERVFEKGVHVLLTPTTLFPAPKPSLFSVRNSSELTYLQDLCTSPANLAGLPALSLPVGFTSDANTNDSSNSTSNTNINNSQSSLANADTFKLSDIDTTTKNDAELLSSLGVNGKCDLSESDIVGVHHGIEGLPLSLQLIGPFGTDSRLMEIGKWIESTVNVPRIVLQDPVRIRHNLES